MENTASKELLLPLSPRLLPHGAFITQELPLSNHLSHHSKVFSLSSPSIHPTVPEALSVGLQPQLATKILRTEMPVI